MAKTMRPGMLNRLFTLRKPVTSRGDHGEEDKTMTAAGTVWGHIRYTTGRENIDSGREMSSSEAVITIRHHTTIAATWDLTYGSRVFRIVAPPVDPEMRHQWTVLRCEEVEGG